MSSNVELCPCGCGHSLVWVSRIGHGCSDEELRQDVRYSFLFHDELEQARPAEAAQTEFVIQPSLFPEIVPDKFELVLPF